MNGNPPIGLDIFLLAFFALLSAGGLFIGWILDLGRRADVRIRKIAGFTDDEKDPGERP